MATAVNLGRANGVEERKAVESTEKTAAPAGVGSAPSSIQSAKEGYLETTVSLFIPGTNKLIFQFPMIWADNGFGFEVQEFDVIKASEWPQGQKITIQHDAQTKEDGTQLCSNGKQQVRVKHTLTVRQ